jgi:hypothetical protein
MRAESAPAIDRAASAVHIPRSICAIPGRSRTSGRNGQVRVSRMIRLSPASTKSGVRNRGPAGPHRRGARGESAPRSGEGPCFVDGVGCADHVATDGRRWIRPPLGLARARRHAPAARGRTRFVRRSSSATSCSPRADWSCGSSTCSPTTTRSRGSRSPRSASWRCSALAMFARWMRRRQSRAASAEAATPITPAEQHFPVAIVGLHGLLATNTLVLVLLTAIGVGGS